MPAVSEVKATTDRRSSNLFFFFFSKSSSDPQTPPTDTFRVAAENYPDEELGNHRSSYSGSGAAAEMHQSGNQRQRDPLTYSPDKPACNL